MGEPAEKSYNPIRRGTFSTGNIVVKGNIPKAANDKVFPSEKAINWTRALVEALENEGRYSIEGYTGVTDLEKLRKDSLVISTKIEMLLINNKYFDKSHIYITDNVLSRNEQDKFINLIYSNAQDGENPNIRYIDDSTYMLSTLNVVGEGGIERINATRSNNGLQLISNKGGKPINTRAFILNNDAAAIYQRVLLKSNTPALQN